MVSQLKVNEIIKQSGSSITIGESGDTLDLSNPTSVTLNSTMKMTPAFEVYQTSSQNPSDNTYTKLTFTGETFDTNSAWSDSKFTVPSGFAGKYAFLLDAGGYDDNTGLDIFRLAIYKNGSAVKINTVFDTDGSSLQTAMACISAILDLSVGDYVEAYINANIDSGTFTTLSNASGTQTRFSGFRILV